MRGRLDEHSGSCPNTGNVVWIVNAALRDPQPYQIGLLLRVRHRQDSGPNSGGPFGFHEPRTKRLSGLRMTVAMFPSQTVR